jgi:hypothetical protein
VCDVPFQGIQETKNARTTNSTNNRIYSTVQKKNSKEHADRIISDRMPAEKDFKISFKKKKQVWEDL